MTTRNPAHSGLGRESSAVRSLRCDTLCNLSGLPADVAKLFVEAESHDPQFGLDWFHNLITTVLPGDEGVFLHVLRINSVAVAALPLYVQETASGRKARALGNFYTCLYAPAMDESVLACDLAALFADIVRVHAPLAWISLAPLDAAAQTSPKLQQALRLAHLVPYSYPAFGNWYLPVTGTCAEYMAGRPGELRSTLRRMGKKFAAAGGRFEIVTASEQVEAAISAYSAVYNTSWKQPEPFERFMPGLAHLSAAKGWLRLGLAWIGDKPVAAQLWIVSGEKAQIYKLAYDTAFGQFSPGSLLTAQLMQHVIEKDGVTEIDYLKGDDAYKNQWMSHRRERLGLLAFNPRTLRGLMGIARESSGRALAALGLRKRPEFSAAQFDKSALHP